MVVVSCLLFPYDGSIWAEYLGTINHFWDEGYPIWLVAATNTEDQAKSGITNRHIHVHNCICMSAEVAP